MRYGWTRALAAVAALACTLAAPAGAGVVAAAQAAPKEPVVLIVLENKTDDSIVGNANSRFRATGRDAQGRVNEELSWPCQKPPWGHLTAIDLNTGEFRWP